MLVTHLQGIENCIKKVGKLLVKDDYFLHCLKPNKYNSLHHEANSRRRPAQERYYNAENISLNLSFYETGKIYITCPISNEVTSVINGKLAPSSLSGITPNFFYQTHSIELGKFYLIMGTVFRNVLGIYIPANQHRDEVLIFSWDQPQHVREDIEHCINNYLKNTIDFHSEKQDIQFSKHTMLSGITPNFGHTFFNEITGLQTLSHYWPEQDNYEWLLGPYFPVNATQSIFGISGPKEPESLGKIAHFIDTNGRLPFLPIDSIIDKRTVRELRSIGEQVSQPEANRLKALTKDQHTIIIAIPNDKWSTPYHLVEKLTHYITELQREFPKLVIIFDGWTKLCRDFSITEKAKLAQIDQTIEAICNKIPEKVTTSNINGHELALKLLAYELTDTYFCMFGSSLTIPSWISNKPGVSYGPRELIEKQWLPLYTAGFFEHMTNTTEQLPPSMVTANYRGFYHFDIQWCIDKTREILADNDYINTESLIS